MPCGCTCGVLSLQFNQISLSGTNPHEANEDNIDIILLCHEKYDCRELGCIAGQYLHGKAGSLTHVNALQTLQGLLRVDPDLESPRDQQKCTDYIAEHHDDILQ